MNRKALWAMAVLFMVSAVVLASCGGGSNGATGPAGPTMPVIQSLYTTGAPASPGDTITATVNAQSAQNLSLTYSWSVSAGWSIVSGQTSTTATITAPNTRGVAGTATVTVTDSNGLIATGAVALSTVAAGAPVAVPGPDQYVLPGTLVWLDGSGSFDPNGYSLTYAWWLVSNPSNTATLSNLTAVNPDFYADALGQYVVSLTANDGVLSSATKTVTVTARTPVPDTGQTAKFTTTFGEDSDYAIHPMSYTDNGDGTVRDNVTGLIWQKCSIGQSDNLCSTGTATAVNWFVASGTYDATYNPGTTNLCGSSTLAGGGWRLPTEYELGTIINFETYSPAVNSVDFPNAPSALSAFYWSSTSYAPSTTNAWCVYFYYGMTNYNGKTLAGSVRCVRGQ